MLRGNGHWELSLLNNDRHKGGTYPRERETRSSAKSVGVSPQVSELAKAFTHLHSAADTVEVGDQPVSTSLGNGKRFIASTFLWCGCGAYVEFALWLGITFLGVALLAYVHRQSCSDDDDDDDNHFVDRRITPNDPTTTGRR